MGCCDCTCFIYGSFYRICKYDLLLLGDAFPGDALSLTNPNKESSQGQVLYDRKIHFSDEGRHAIFETTITFKMCGADACGCPNDGIIFFIAPANYCVEKDGKEDEKTFAVEFDISGTVTASVRPSGKKFAVELDTSGTVAQTVPASGTDTIGTDTTPVPASGTDTIGTDTTPVPEIDVSGKGEPPVIEAKDIVGKKVTATITYRERKVTVVAVVGTKVYNLSYEVDLKKVLPEYVQVGIIGCAGKLHDGRCIFSWSFASALVHDNFCCCC